MPEFRPPDNTDQPRRTRDSQRAAPKPVAKPATPRAPRPSLPWRSFLPKHPAELAIALGLGLFVACYTVIDRRDLTLLRHDYDRRSAIDALRFLAAVIALAGIYFRLAGKTRI